MMPLGTPEARCSARRHSSANSTGVMSAPSASATATSSAALLDNPAPIGMSVRDPTADAGRRPELGHHTGDVPSPLGADGGGIVDRQGQPHRVGLVVGDELDVGRRGSNLISVHRSMAIGRTNPPV